MFDDDWNTFPSLVTLVSIISRTGAAIWSKTNFGITDQRFRRHHLKCIKMLAFQFYLQSGKQRKVGWLGDDNYVIFQQKFSGDKGSVRRCVVVMQQPVHLPPKFGEKSLHIFKQAPHNITVVCGIDSLASQDEFFVNNPLDVEENGEHALDLALRLFGPVLWENHSFVSGS
jgi:hypothetical protein